MIEVASSRHIFAVALCGQIQQRAACQHHVAAVFPPSLVGEGHHLTDERRKLLTRPGLHLYGRLNGQRCDHRHGGSREGSSEYHLS